MPVELDRESIISELLDFGWKWLERLQEQEANQQSVFLRQLSHIASPEVY